MIKELTLAGDHQVGKSYGAMVLAVDAAKRGQKVIYDCDSRRTLSERFNQLQNLSPTEEISALRWTNGKERIYFRSGGVILMLVGGGRGITADVHVIDHDRDRGEANPTVQRVIRTELVPA